MTKQLLVSGSRDMADYEIFAATLDHYIETMGKPDVIIHGGAPGADSLASRYAHENKIDLDIYGAWWGTMGAKAGPHRNARMAKCLKKGDYSIFFMAENSRGTKDMLEKVTALGTIPTFVTYLHSA